MRNKITKPTLYAELIKIAIIIVVIPIIFTGLYLRQSNVVAYEQISARAGEMSIREASLVIEAYFSRAAAVADNVASDNMIQSILVKTQDEYTASERIDDIRTLRILLSNYERESLISGIRLVFMEDQQWLSNNSYFSINMDSFKAQLIKKGIKLDSDVMPLTPLWFGPDFQFEGTGMYPQESISYVRIIRDMQNFDRILGYVLIYQNIAFFESLLLESDITGESVLALVDDNGTLIAKGRGGQKHEKLWQSYNKGQIKASTLVLNAPMLSNGWTLSMLLPQSAYSKNVTLLTINVLAISFTLITICILYARRTYRRIHGRIADIVACMERVRQGDLETRITVLRDDEIGYIESHFNHMLSQLSILMEQTIQMEKQDRLIRIRLLRSQINPHFLYNTLNSILWASMDYGAVRVCQMIKALSDFYKIALKPGSDEVTIRHELMHVQRYISLQKLRGGIEVTIQMNIDDALLDSLIPNMLLQPLVENCFMHGFLGKEKGSIELSVKSNSDGKICISVKDDGIGMSNESIKEVLSRTSPEHSYGLYSIWERLRLRFGDEAAFSLSSPESGGCSIQITVPVDTHSTEQSQCFKAKPSKVPDTNRHRHN